MTEAYTTIACSLTRESTMVTDGTIMTSSLDIIGLCTESILVVMVEEDMVSLSACPLLNRVLVMVTNASRACFLLMSKCLIYRYNRPWYCDIATCKTLLSRQIIFNRKDSSSV